MAEKFNGSFEQLHTLLSRSNVVGTWAPEPNGVYMLRCPNGANLHWASGSKTLWFDGVPAAARALKEVMAEALRQRT